MEANRSKLKGRQPELLVDFNGNPVQRAWMMGGKTIEVTDGSTFVCESTLMRICNLGEGVVNLTYEGADYSSIPSSNTGSDKGLPLLPMTCEIFSVYHEGACFSVSGGDIQVTFVFDHRTKLD